MGSCCDLVAGGVSALTAQRAGAGAGGLRGTKASCFRSRTKGAGANLGQLELLTVLEEASWFFKVSR